MLFFIFSEFTPAKLVKIKENLFKTDICNQCCFGLAAIVPYLSS